MWIRWIRIRIRNTGSNSVENHVYVGGPDCHDCVQVPGPQDPAGGQRLHAQNKGTGEPSKIVPVLRIRIMDPVPFLPMDPRLVFSSSRIPNPYF
jgi:hypothetical protein